MKRIVSLIFVTLFSFGAFAAPTLIVFGPDSDGRTKEALGMIKSSCQRKDCFIIDGTDLNKTTDDLLQSLDDFKNKVGSNNSELTVLLFAHGVRANENQYIDNHVVVYRGEHIFKFGRDKVYSADFFGQLGNSFEKVNVMMISCYSGACETNALNYLPTGSRIFATSPAKDITSKSNAIGFFQGIKENPSNLDFEDLVFRYFLDGTYFLWEEPQLLGADKKNYGSVVEALVGKIGLPFTSKEKEKILNKLSSYLSKEQIELAVTSIESGDFNFYDDVMNHRLAVIYALAEDFIFDLELIKRGKRNLIHMPLPFRDALTARNNRFFPNSLYNDLFQRHEREQNRFYFVFSENNIPNEYNVVYRINDNQAKHTYSYVFKVIKIYNNTWTFRDDHRLNFDHTRIHTQIYKQINRTYPVDFALPDHPPSVCDQNYSIIISNKYSK